MKRPAFPLLVALVVGLFAAGCAPSPPDRSAATGNRAHDLLVQKSGSEQASLLAVTVRASGSGCSAPQRPFFQGLDRTTKTATWNLDCGSGDSFSIGVAADASGSTKVVSCSVLAAVANVQCFKTFDQQK